MTKLHMSDDLRTPRTPRGSATTQHASDQVIGGSSVIQKDAGNTTESRTDVGTAQPREFLLTSMPTLILRAAALACVSVLCDACAGASPNFKPFPLQASPNFNLPPASKTSNDRGDDAECFGMITQESFDRKRRVHRCASDPQERVQRTVGQGVDVLAVTHRQVPQTGKIVDTPVVLQ